MILISFHGTLNPCHTVSNISEAFSNRHLSPQSVAHLTNMSKIIFANYLRPEQAERCMS